MFLAEKANYKESCYYLIWVGDSHSQSSIYPPLGIGYIAALMKKHNQKVFIIDLTFDPELKQIQKLQSKKGIYGLSFTTPKYGIAMEIIKILKNNDPAGVIVAGGPHPTAIPDELLLNCPVDFVVKGEGELTSLDLVEAIKAGNDTKKVKGLYYKDGSEVIFSGEREYIENLDILPFPFYQELLIEKYFKKKGYRELSMITSRGCPHNCIYCQPLLRGIFGKNTRYRSAKNVVDEIEYFIKKLKLEMIVFSDDTFTSDKKRIIDICREIIRRKIKVLWRCQTDVRIDKETLVWMKKAGCFLIAFGVESGSQQILIKIRKGVKVGWIEKAFKNCHAVGILSHAYLMVGNIGETKETVQETIRLIKKIKPFSFSVAITTPYPATDLYKCVVENKLLEQTDWRYFNYLSTDSASIIKLDTISHEGLREAKNAIDTIKLGLMQRIKDIIKLIDLNLISILISTVIRNPSSIKRMTSLVLRRITQDGFESNNPSYNLKQEK